MVDTLQMQDRSFEYMYVPIDDLEVITEESEKTKKKLVSHVSVNGEPFRDSSRFWTSLFSRYGFNSAFFKYFDHAEVFKRISERERGGGSGKIMRVCVERTTTRDGSKNQRLLAVSNPNTPIAPYNDLVGMVKEQGGESINYSDGVVESRHRPMGNNKFEVLGDDFENRFIIQTPIDGFGQPNIYLSMLRMVCTNGMVAFSKSFRTGIGIGKGEDNVMPSILRAIDGFNNEEGFAALRERIEKAGKSWLSIYEYQQLYRILLGTYINDDIQPTDLTKGSIVSRLLAQRQSEIMGSSPGDEPDELSKSYILGAFHRMGGNPQRRYGLANLDALSVKRQRTLPVGCTVYDAINFVTEVATHHSTAAGHRKLQSWVGTTVTDEYDMEGTMDKFQEFDDFFIDSKFRNQLTGSKA